MATYVKPRKGTVGTEPLICLRCRQEISRRPVKEGDRLYWKDGSEVPSGFYHDECWHAAHAGPTPAFVRERLQYQARCHFCRWYSGWLSKARAEQLVAEHNEKEHG